MDSSQTTWFCLILANTQPSMGARNKANDAPAYGAGTFAVGSSLLDLKV